MIVRTLILLVCTAAAVQAEEKKPKAVDPLLGPWEVVSASFNGAEVPKLKGRTLLFTEKEFTTYEGDQKGRTVSFTRDDKASPKQIDMERGDGAKAKGIYAIEKAQLKICYGEPDTDRPKEMESPAGKKLFYLILKKVKEN